jgi:hypothetical protein
MSVKQMLEYFPSLFRPKSSLFPLEKGEIAPTAEDSPIWAIDYSLTDVMWNAGGQLNGNFY